MEDNIDIFEYIKEKLGLTYISDLPSNDLLVFHVLQRLNLDKLDKEKLDDLAQYVFHASAEELKEVLKTRKEV